MLAEDKTGQIETDEVRSGLAASPHYSDGAGLAPLSRPRWEIGGCIIHLGHSDRSHLSTK